MTAEVNSDPELACIDKNILYGKFEAGEKRNRKRRDWKDELYKKVVSKSVDVALDDDEEMEVQANKTITNNGMGAKELAMIGAMLLGTGAGGAGLTALLMDKNEPVVEQAAPVQHTDTDTLFDLEFADPQ